MGEAPRLTLITVALAVWDSVGGEAQELLRGTPPTSHNGGTSCFLRGPLYKYMYTRIRIRARADASAP